MLFTDTELTKLLPECNEQIRCELVNLSKLESNSCYRPDIGQMSFFCHPIFVKRPTTGR